MKNLLLTASVLLLSVSTARGQHWSLTWERMNSTGPSLRQSGRVAVSPSSQTGPSIWSVGCETLDRDYAVFDNYKDYLGELGVSSARIQSGWAKTEQKKGRYDFSWLDEIVNGIHAQGVQPWVCLCYGNPLYGANKGLGSRIFTDEETMQAWLRYVEATVSRYKDTVNEWEIWNEPNLGQNTRYSDAYARLLMETAQVIKKIQPDAIIIGFGMSRMPLGFTRQVYDILRDNGLQDIVDYVSFHPYFENPDHAAEQIAALRDLVTSYDPTVKLFQGECGCPSTLEWGHALRYHEWTEYSQAKWVLRRMAGDWMMGIRSSIFTLVDLQYPNMLQSFGLVRTNLLKEPVYKRPSYHAVQNMVNLLDGTAQVCSGPLAYRANTDRGITVAGIGDKEGNQYGALLWYNDRIPGDDLEWDPVDIRIEGLTIKDPVYVEIITGRVYDLPKHQGQSYGGDMKFMGLPLWDSPVMVIERSSLTLEDASGGRKATGSTNDMLY